MTGTIRIALGCGLLVSTSAFGLASTKTRYAESFFPEGNIERVVIAADIGDVVIVPGEEVRVERHVKGFKNALDVSHVVTDGTLTVAAVCTTILPCRVDTKLTVPVGMGVHVDVGAGEIVANSIGPLSAELGAGVVEADVIGNLRVQLGTGSVHASVVDAESVKIGLGDGDVEVTLPSEDWAMDISATRLNLQGIESTEAGSNRLAIMAPAGTVLVRGQDPVALR